MFHLFGCVVFCFNLFEKGVFSLPLWERRLSDTSFGKGGVHGNQGGQSKPNLAKLWKRQMGVWQSRCWQARGALSATLIRELADCAIQDGAQHTDLVAIAQAGNWGAQPGNVHKQLMGHFCSNVQIAECIEVEVPCIHPKTSKDALEGHRLFYHT